MIERKTNWTKVKENIKNVRNQNFRIEKQNCGHSLGKKDVLIIDLETVKYCSKCIEKYIKETPFDIPDGTVVKDFGDSVYLKYKSGGYIEQTVLKDCYFNTKGRYIKVKGKRVYI